MPQSILRLVLVCLLAITAGGLAWLDTAAAGMPVGECHDANSLHDHDEADEHCVHSAARARASDDLALQPCPDRPDAAVLPACVRAALPIPATPPAWRAAMREQRRLEPPQLHALSVVRLLI